MACYHHPNNTTCCPTRATHHREAAAAFNAMYADVAASLALASAPVKLESLTNSLPVTTTTTNTAPLVEATAPTIAAAYLPDAGPCRAPHHELTLAEQYNPPRCYLMPSCHGLMASNTQRTIIFPGSGWRLSQQKTLADE